MIKVLLVDDHIYIRKAIRQLLETTRYIQVVATACNGIEAVDKAHSHRPDIVIMDISMSLMDGLEATRQILADIPDIRVLMLSSHDNQEYIQSALEAGAVGYVVKEAIAREMLEAIRSLFGGGRYFCREIIDKVDQRMGGQ